MTSQSMQAALYAEDRGEALAALLASGADASGRGEDGRGYTPLHTVAIMDGGSGLEEERKARLLIAAQADTNAVADTMYGAGWTPLHLAAYEGTLGVVQALLDGGADPDAMTIGDGRTPLHFAAEYGRSLVVALLLRSNARKDIRDEAGRTALDAAEQGLQRLRAMFNELEGDERASFRSWIEESMECVRLLRSN